MVNKKQFGYTASILKDTNRLIASSQANWASLPEGSYIIFDEDEDFYKVIDKEQFFFIKDFHRVDNDKILVKGDLGVKLTLNDNLTLTFKEYEASSLEIINGGKGFSVGDILTVEGGECKTDVMNDLNSPTEIKITEVNKNGSIIKAELKHPGLYTLSPESGQTLEGAELDIKYSLLDKRTVENRSVANVALTQDGNTLIHLNHPLPTNVKHGKFSVSKWELILNVNYPKSTKINSSYRVISDFTPHLGIPLMKDDTDNYKILFNDAVTKIEKKLIELEEKAKED